MSSAHGGDRAAPRRTTLTLVWQAASWLVPSAALVAMPKCPLCVAAYVAMFTGLGLSFAAAYYTRLGLIALCVLMLAWQTTRWWRARQRRAQPPTLVCLQLPGDLRK